MDWPPQITALLRALLRSVQNLTNAVQQQAEAAERAKCAAQKRDEPTPKILAEVTFPEVIEKAKGEQDIKKYHLQQWNVAFAGVTCLFVIIYAAVAAWQLCEMRKITRLTERALVANSRAWIAPANAYFTSKIATGIPLSWEVQYRNTGKSPALDVHPIYSLQQIPASKFDDNTFNDFIETDEASNSCGRLEPKPGADVAYSEQPDPYKLIFANHLPDWVHDDVPAGRTALVLQMCFAYKTMGEIHRTSFCYFYRAGVSPSNNQMNICTAGNHAD